MTCAGIRALARALSKFNSTLHSLNLQGCDLSDLSAMRLLGRVVADTRTLRTLYLNAELPLSSICVARELDLRKRVCSSLSRVVE